MPITDITTDIFHMKLLISPQIYFICKLSPKQRFVFLKNQLERDYIPLSSYLIGITLIIASAIKAVSPGND